MTGKGNSKILLSKDDLSKIKQVIDKIEAQPEAVGFLEPVDYIGIFQFTPQRTSINRLSQDN
jgi:hypothetical protein